MFSTDQSFLSADFVRKVQEEQYTCLSATFRYRVLSEDRFDKPDIYPTTIASCSSGQKAGLTQSSSRSITWAPHTYWLTTY
jgi:hypothetical protein